MTYNDIVISTRVRLARNLSDFPFECRIDAEDKMKIVDRVSKAIFDSNSVIANDFTLIDMTKLKKSELLSMVEKHLISPEFAKKTLGRAVLINKDHTVSIMINEEDHIRLQVIENGFDIENAYDIADKIDTLLDENLNFAFNEKLGYLTQCPTNLGTGMRASVMLHLPALQSSKAIARICDSLSKLGFTLRGTYGEGSEAKGAMYQLSNQVSLGISEKSALENLKNIAVQLINQERQAREHMFTSIEIQDGISRSLGVLKYARSISHNEAMQLLSNVRLGIISGEFSDLKLSDIDNLFTEIQPACLMEKLGKELKQFERDEERAKLIKSVIK